MTRWPRWARVFGIALPLLAWCIPIPCLAQYTAPYVNLTGTLSASNGMPAQNYVLGFQPNQLFFVGGTSVVVSGSTCATDASGAVVGVRNPLSATPLAVGYTGTLPIGNYWVEAAWYDTYGNQTLPSPAAMAQLTVQGQIVVSPPAGGAPANAIGMDVYAGTSATSLYYQGQTASTTSSYTQSAPLTTTTAAPPTRNATVCQVVANDAGWPTGTGYQFSMTDGSGNTLPGYPVLLQFLGAGSTYNLSNGLPYYNGRVIYPVPVLTQPTGHNMQSINGPLSMGQPGGVGYNIVNVGELGVGTALPAWGVDVEGSALAGAVNAKTGFLVNGEAGASGQCLTSDGSYYDTPENCVESLPTIYYQTLRDNGTDLTQRLILNFGPEFAVADYPRVPEPTSWTQVDLANTGVTAGSCTFCGLTINAFGQVTAQSSGTLPSGTVATGTAAGCAFANDGNGLTCGPVTVTLGAAMPDTSYTANCTANFSNTIATTTSAMPSLGLNWAPASTTTVTVYEGVNNGSSTGYGISTSYGVTLTCVAHHY